MPTTDRELDILALRFFLILAETHSHKETVTRLGLSSPKGSRLLNELRAYFHDDLFVRFGAHMFPTRHAETLLPEVKQILSRLSEMTKTEIFDPQQLRRSIRIGAFDAGVASFIAGITPKFSRLAPHAKLEVFQITDTLVQDLKQGLIDMAITPWMNSFVDLKTHIIFERRYRILVMKNHPLVARYKERGCLMCTDLQHYRQVTVALEATYTWGNEVDRNALGTQAVNMRSEVAVTTPYFLSVPLLVMDTDYYAFVTQQMGQMFVERYPELALLPLPENKSLISHPTMLVWTEATQDDVALQWVRGLFLTSKEEQTFY